jgi:hypothetical protein
MSTKASWDNTLLPVDTVGDEVKGEIDEDF